MSILKNFLHFSVSLTRGTLPSTSAELMDPSPRFLCPFDHLWLYHLPLRPETLDLQGPLPSRIQQYLHPGSDPFQPLVIWEVLKVFHE